MIKIYRVINFPFLRFISVLVCWTPYFAMMLIFMFTNVDERLSEDLQSGIFFFGMSTSLINPIIYGAFQYQPTKKRRHYLKRRYSLGMMDGWVIWEDFAFCIFFFQSYKYYRTVFTSIEMVQFYIEASQRMPRWVSGWFNLNSLWLIVIHLINRLSKIWTTTTMLRCIPIIDALMSHIHMSPQKVKV